MDNLSFNKRLKSEEHKKKIAAAHMGKKQTEQTKRKISETRKKLYSDGKLVHGPLGKKWSKERRESFGLLRRGKTHEEFYGKEKAEQMHKKYSETVKKSYVEGKRKPNLCWLGRKHTEEEKLKIGIGNKGKVVSAESKEKMRISQTGKHELEKNHMWLGGKSFEPYTKEFNDKFKEAIKIRDGFICLKCAMKEEDSLILLKRKLTCHHIDYIKANSFKENCCALCYRCNLEVNVNRESWTNFFQSLLSEKYGYKYFEDGNVIIELTTGGNTNEHL